MEKYQHCHQCQNVQELYKNQCICNLPKDLQRICFLNIVKDIVTSVIYLYSSASPAICLSFMFLFCLVFAMFFARLFICASWSPAGKRLTSWLSFVVSSVSLSLSHWYPGSGVVLDCIDS